MSKAQAQGRYTCVPQQRILKLVTLLAGNEIHGLAPSEIASAQRCSAALVTRDLANLAEVGLAEQVPETGRWRLGPQIVQIALRHQVGIDRAQQKVEEIRQRYSRI